MRNLAPARDLDIHKNTVWNGISSELKNTVLDGVP